MAIHSWKLVKIHIRLSSNLSVSKIVFSVKRDGYIRESELFFKCHMKQRFGHRSAKWPTNDCCHGWHSSSCTSRYLRCETPVFSVCRDAASGLCNYVTTRHLFYNFPSLMKKMDSLLRIEIRNWNSFLEKLKSLVLTNFSFFFVPKQFKHGKWVMISRLLLLELWPPICCRA